MLEAPESLADRLAALEGKFAELQAQTARLNDIEAIKRLHSIYSYYLEKCMYQEIVDLFALGRDDAWVEIGGRGRYVGGKGVRTYFLQVQTHSGRDQAVPFGRMAFPTMSSPVVDVTADGQCAQGRFRLLSCMGLFEETMLWLGGIYEVVYVKQDGIWKILSLDHKQQFICRHHGGGLISEPLYSGLPNEDYPPHQPSAGYHPFPEVANVPFHYNHPVTGEPHQQYGLTGTYWTQERREAAASWVAPKD